VLNFENTDEGSTLLPLRGMGECVVTVGGLQPTFTTCMGGVEIKKIGESITLTWSAYAESVTHLDISERKNNEIQEETDSN